MFNDVMREWLHCCHMTFGCLDLGQAGRVYIVKRDTSYKNRLITFA